MPERCNVDLYSDVSVHAAGQKRLRDHVRLVHVAGFCNDDGHGRRPRGHGSAALFPDNGPMHGKALGLLSSATGREEGGGARRRKRRGRALAVGHEGSSRVASVSLGRTGEAASEPASTRSESVAASEAGGVGGGSAATYFLSATSMSDGSRTCCIATHCNLSSWRWGKRVREGTDRTGSGCRGGRGRPRLRSAPRLASAALCPAALPPAPRWPRSAFSTAQSCYAASVVGLMCGWCEPGGRQWSGAGWAPCSTGRRGRDRYLVALVCRFEVLLHAAQARLWAEAELGDAAAQRRRGW